MAETLFFLLTLARPRLRPYPASSAAWLANRPPADREFRVFLVTKV